MSVVYDAIPQRWGGDVDTIVRCTGRAAPAIRTTGDVVTLDIDLPPHTASMAAWCLRDGECRPYRERRCPFGDKGWISIQSASYSRRLCPGWTRSSRSGQSVPPGPGRPARYPSHRPAESVPVRCGIYTRRTGTHSGQVGRSSPRSAPASGGRRLLLRIRQLASVSQRARIHWSRRSSRRQRG